MGADRKYKIKLGSGRIVGPIDRDQVLKFIKKKHILGEEQARVHPDGEWKEFRSIPELAELLMAHLLGGDPAETPRKSAESSGKTATVKLAETKVLGGGQATLAVGAGPDAEGEATVVAEVSSSERSGASEDSEDATKVDLGGEGDESGSGSIERESQPKRLPVRVTEQETVVFQAPDRALSATGEGEGGGGVGLLDVQGIRTRRRPNLRPILIVLAVGFLVYQALDWFQPKSGSQPLTAVVRPQSPNYGAQPRDVIASKKLFEEGVRSFEEDNVVALRKAAALLLKSASLDQSNSSAHALLASAYLGLIDSVNKDENYFSVIYGLIGVAQGKDTETPESVQAYVDYYLVADRVEAARDKIVSYTKTHQYGPAIYYLLAKVLYARRDFQEAASYLQQIADRDIFSPKIYYLRGLVAKELDTEENAIRQFELAIKMNSAHAKSRLQIVRLMEKVGQLSKAGPHLEFLALNPGLLSPPDLAEAFYYRSRWKTLERRTDEALGDIERAVKLMPDNANYRLEYYALRATEGAPAGATVSKARLFYFLDHGQRLLKEGKYQEALTEFMQARQANPDSPLPLEKMGDMFLVMNDIRNARDNYKKAAEMSPGSAEVWSKYIGALIDMYEWKDAREAIEKIRPNPRAQSAIDKRAGDMFAKQGLHVEAIKLYKKAMGHTEIDPAVYISFAKSLMALKQAKDAVLFFSLARRLDPMNVEAIRGTAQALAETEGIEGATLYLRDELQRGSTPKAEVLSVLGDLELQRGEYGRADSYVQQAIAANPMVAAPWKLKAKIILARDGENPKALEKALAAFKAFSDRNPADPTGYEERYLIFHRQKQYEAAFEELDKIFALYPRYPKLHQYRGKLYTTMGDYKKAGEEYKSELANHPNDANVMVQLGSALLQQQKQDEALQWFVKAMTLAPEAAEPKHYAGYAQYQMKNYPAAIALLIQAARIDPGNPQIFKRLGLSYLAMGDNAKAAEAFRKYLELAPDAPDRDKVTPYL